MWTGVPSNEDVAALQTNSGKQVFELFAKIKKANQRDLLQNIDPQCMDLIGKSLHFNPDKRLTIE